MVINFSSKQLLEFVQTFLILVVLGLLLWSQPWNQAGSSVSRKVSVGGEASIKAEPDEYVFSPYFNESGKDKEAIKTSLNEKANAAVAKLKELGVEEKDIKLDASSYDYWYIQGNEDGNLNIMLNITVHNKDAAQKVQDYLLTLPLEGQLTPQAQFSEAKKKELNSQATEEAIKDAKQKAEQQATLLGAKVGKVIEVGQPTEVNFPIAYSGSELTVDSANAQRSSLPVLAGQNDYTLQITVTYELK
jgi:uncharacterized protein